MIRQTHTFVLMDVSRAAYDEIAAKLKAVDYDHAFIEDHGKIVLDMHGVALALDDDNG